MNRALAIVIAGSLAIALVKLAYGEALARLAIAADGLHGVLETLALALAFVIVARTSAASRPRVERAVGVAIGVLMLQIAIQVVWEAFARTAPTDARVDPVAIGVVFATAAGLFWLASYQQRVGDRERNVMLLSNAGHTRADAWATLLLLVPTTFGALDRIAAVVIAIAIAYGGIDTMRVAMRTAARTDRFRR